MRDHIEAIKALAAPLGYPIYYVDVPEDPKPGYVLLWSSPGGPLAEASVEPVGDFTDELGVTAVAATPLGVLDLHGKLRHVLNGARPVVEGREVWLNLFASQRVTVDRDVTPHVPYGVDLYRLISTPA